MSGASSVDQERLVLGKAAELRLGLRKIRESEDGPALRGIEAAVIATAASLHRRRSHLELVHEAVLELHRRSSRRSIERAAGELRRYGADVPGSSVEAAIEERAQVTTARWMERH